MHLPRTTIAGVAIVLGVFGLLSLAWARRRQRSGEQA